MSDKNESQKDMPDLAELNTFEKCFAKEWLSDEDEEEFKDFQKSFSSTIFQFGKIGHP